MKVSLTSAYTWSKQNLFLRQEQADAEARGGTLPGTAFSRCWLQCLCTGGKQQRHPLSPHPSSSLTLCYSSLIHSIKRQLTWSRGVPQYRWSSIQDTFNLLHSYCSIPKMKLFAQIKAIFFLAAPQSGGKRNAHHGMWPDRWPTAMCQVPQALPALLLKCSTKLFLCQVMPKAGYSPALLLRGRSFKTPPNGVFTEERCPDSW